MKFFWEPPFLTLLEVVYCLVVAAIVYTAFGLLNEWPPPRSLLLMMFTILLYVKFGRPLLWGEEKWRLMSGRPKRDDT